MTFRDIGVLIILAAIWGSSFLFMRLGVPELGPFVLVAGRVALAAIVLTLLVAFKGLLPELWAERKHLSILSLFLTGIPFLFFSIASVKVPAAVLSVLNATAPLWTSVIALIWLKERITLLQVFGMSIGFSGVLLLISSQMGLNDASMDVSWYIFLPILSTFCYGIGNNYTRKYLRHVSALTMAAGSQISSAILLAPLAYIFWPTGEVSTTAWFSMVFLGLICSGLAFILLFYLISRVGVIKSTGVTFLVPIFGSLWGYLFLHENITLSTLLSGGLIFLGLLATMGLTPKKKSS